MQTPTSPVARAMPWAMKPAPCSWRASTWWITVDCRQRIVDRQDGAARVAGDDADALAFEQADDDLGTAKGFLRVWQNGALAPDTGVVEQGHIRTDRGEKRNPDRCQPWREDDRQQLPPALAMLARAALPRAAS
jgi:hypothetical protein